MSERTLVLVKPDGVRRGVVGDVISRIERKGLKLVALELRTLTRDVAEEHYAEHRERPFFGELVEYMTSGPVIVIALRRENAVAHWRQVIGATNPEKADAGTLRKQFGKSLTANALHGSDSPENGLRETAYFFTGAELGR